MGLLAGLIALLVLRGAGGLTFDFLLGMPARGGRDGGILSVLLNTGGMVGGAMLLAVPLGVGAALYLSEYARDGPLLRAMRGLTEAQAAVPSIIFGLFGYSLFVKHLGWNWSLASGSATLALMLLPTVIRTSEEALAAVPRELRDGAAALGASRWEATRLVLLREAAPGVLTGAILALGRAIGESAALLLTAGSGVRMPTSPFDTGRSLSVHLYILATEGVAEDRAYTTALVLMLAVLAVNTAANIVLRRWRKA